MRTNGLNDIETESVKRILQLIDDECEGRAQIFADKTGIGKASVSHYKHFRHAPNQNHAYLIAKAFKVNPMWVMGFDVPKDEQTLEDLPLSPVGKIAVHTNAQLLLDKPLQEALEIYFTLSPEEKQHVIRAALNAAYESMLQKKGA